MTNSEHVRVDHDGDVATVTIDRPRRKNACTPDMWAALRTAFDEISEGSARAVVLTGAGGDFCAGADVSGGNQSNRDSAQSESGSPDAAELTQRGATPGGRGVDSMRDIAATVMAIHDCRKPVIAKVDGVAVGAGLGLALAADLLWCSDRARFSLIFARRGLSLDFGTSWMLPKRIGLHEAKRLAFTGEIIDAQRGAELGIVNEVVPAAELDAAVDKLAAEIAAGPTIALGISKRYLNGASALSLFQALETEALGQAVNFKTADTSEAMRAFAEKREPVFRAQ